MNDDFKRLLELEAIIQKFLQSDAAAAARAIRDDMLYRDAGYETFKEYLRTLLPPIDDETLDGFLVMLGP
jgi:hypothetical protein